MAMERNWRRFGCGLLLRCCDSSSYCWLEAEWRVKKKRNGGLIACCCCIVDCWFGLLVSVIWVSCYLLAAEWRVEKKSVGVQ